jgi:hypothetical protein
LEALMVTTRKMPDAKCPVCGHAFSAASNALDNERGPRPGDWSICIGCGTVLAFDATLRPRALTKAEQRAADADPRIRKVQHAHRMMQHLKSHQPELAKSILGKKR